MIFKARNYTLDLSSGAKVMAVINLTPDSFYEGSRHNIQSAVEHAKEAAAKGAAIIDLGAQSTAPNSTPITAQEELKRLIEPLRAVREAVDLPISVDTFFPQVAREALQNRADIINDVSGKASGEMTSIAAEFDAGWIAMHTGGLLSSDERNCRIDIINEINSFFNDVIKKADNFGLSKDHLCLDPGIGFGKTREDDLRIIAHFSRLESFGCATLAALSRKRVTRLCGDALTGTIVSNAACIAGGANIIRVHDVEQGLAAAEMARLLRES